MSARIKRYKVILYVATFLWLHIFIAKSQTWNSSGAGKDVYVPDMVIYSNKLYTLVDGSKGMLYEFDGTKWDSILPGYTSGAPDCFTVWNNKLISGGQYTGVVGVANTRKIAAWDRINNQWSALGTGGPSTAATVKSMAVYKNELYVGGSFTSMGGVTVNRIASWNGTQWKDVGGGVTGGLGYINAMVVYKDELYVGGSFTEAGGKPAYYIARWNGTKWDSLQGGVDGVVSSMVVDSIKNLLYVGGGFFVADDTIPVNYVAQWDSVNWKAPGRCPTQGAITMCMYNDELYVGSAGLVGSDTALVKWDGNQWQQIIGPNDLVQSLIVYESNLYVGGIFTDINGDNTIQKLACYGNSCPQNVGINSLDGSGLRFKVFPNPVKNELIIKLEMVTNKSFSITIRDIVGKQVLVKNIFNNEISLQTSGYIDGTYLIEICDETGNRCVTEKIIINN